MYTGLIHSVGTILESIPTNAGVRLVVAAPPTLLTDPGPTPGESINIDGCCLSLVESRAESDHLALAFDATPQTLANTTLGRLQPGARIHLERSCTPTTLLGGHLVQGHVDAVATISPVTKHP
ncbi:MAG: riboflavin synthase, partial [Phycisphaerales bacterium JB060]